MNTALIRDILARVLREELHALDLWNEPRPPPPADPRLERRVLCVELRGHACHAFADLHPADFWDPVNAAAWEACKETGAGNVAAAGAEAVEQRFVAACRHLQSRGYRLSYAGEILSALRDDEEPVENLRKAADRLRELRQRRWVLRLMGELDRRMRDNRPSVRHESRKLIDAVLDALADWGHPDTYAEPSAGGSDS